MYGLEMVALTKRQEAKRMMLRLSMGVTTMDKIRNEYIIGQLGSNGFGGKV